MSRIMKHLLTVLLLFCFGREFARAEDQPQGKAATPDKGKAPTEEKAKVSRPNSARQILKVADLLESPNAAERERAAAELLLYGEQFLPALRESLQKMTDVETRRRLQVIVVELEERRMTQARRVSLKLENKKLSSIFEELQKQTGYKIQFPEPQGEDNRYSLKLENASFWEAVDKACELGGGKLNFANFSNRGESQFSFQLMDSHDPHVAYAGPCRLEAAYLQTNKNLALGRIPRGKKPVRQPENINLSFQLYTEPKAPISNSGWINAEAVSAVDEHGASMLVPGQADSQDVETRYGNAYWGGNRRVNFSSLNVSLFRPGPDSTMIKELRVKAKIPMVTGSREILTINDPLDAVGKRFQSGDFDFIIDSAKYDNGSFTLKLTAVRKHGGENNLYGLILGMIEVYDSRDRMYSIVQNGEFKNGFNIITMDLTYGPDQFQNDNIKLGKPKKICFSEPVVVEKQFDFLFKNIPIP